MPIHILAPEVANQIAAGEVVERPTSAVKELIENSLDAGATDIRVEVREGGRRLIRVQDDGCGIPADEAALAFERHTTSKLATADDLSHLTTLGFRGEALASIASVAQVTLLTRTRAEETGMLIRMAEGREIDREPRGGPPGTLVTVEHLFANVPPASSSSNSRPPRPPTSNRSSPATRWPTRSAASAWSATASWSSSPPAAASCTTCW